LSRVGGAPRARTPRPPNGAEELLALHIRALGLPPPVREHAFAEHLGRGWKFDFAWPDSRPPKIGALVALEVEGEAHRIRERFRSDLAKYNAAQVLGWIVLRFRPCEVRSGLASLVLESIFKGLDPVAALGVGAQKQRRSP
jgi:hypothetical protein